jgi:hypothetical protein
VPVRAPSLAAIRRASGSELADGTIRLLFVRTGGRIGLVQTPQEAANDADQFLARYLERMITDVAAPGVVVAIHRSDDKPSGSDRQLWTMLNERLEPTATRFLDLVVIGPARVWSLRHGRTLNPPRRRANRRSGARRSASRAAAR